MNAEQFVYWLQGYFELEMARTTHQSPIITANQSKVIMDHLALVLNKITPDRTVKVENGTAKTEAIFPYYNEVNTCFSVFKDSKIC